MKDLNSFIINESGKEEELLHFFTDNDYSKESEDFKKGYWAAASIFHDIIISGSDGALIKMIKNIYKDSAEFKKFIDGLF